MSHFYGTLQGSRGRTTRCGTKTSGVQTIAAGWGGAIQVDVQVNQDGDDYYTVWLRPWQGSGGKMVLIAEGKLDSQGISE